MATVKAGSDWQLATSNTTFSVQCVSVQELEIKRMATATTPALPACTKASKDRKRNLLTALRG